MPANNNNQGNNVPQRRFNRQSTITINNAAFLHGKNAITVNSKDGTKVGNMNSYTKEFRQAGGEIVGQVKGYFKSQDDFGAQSVGGVVTTGITAVRTIKGVEKTARGVYQVGDAVVKVSKTASLTASIYKATGGKGLIPMNKNTWTLFKSAANATGLSSNKIVQRINRSVNMIKTVTTAPVKTAKTIGRAVRGVYRVGDVAVKVVKTAAITASILKLTGGKGLIRMNKTTWNLLKSASKYTGLSSTIIVKKLTHSVHRLKTGVTIRLRTNGMTGMRFRFVKGQLKAIHSTKIVLNNVSKVVKQGGLPVIGIKCVCKYLNLNQKNVLLGLKSIRKIEIGRRGIVSLHGLSGAAQKILLTKGQFKAIQGFVKVLTVYNAGKAVREAIAGSKVFKLGKSVLTKGVKTVGKVAGTAENALSKSDNLGLQGVGMSIKLVRYSIKTAKVTMGVSKASYKGVKTIARTWVKTVKSVVRTGKAVGKFVSKRGFRAAYSHYQKRAAQAFAKAGRSVVTAIFNGAKALLSLLGTKIVVPLIIIIGIFVYYFHDQRSCGVGFYLVWRFIYR